MTIDVTTTAQPVAEPQASGEVVLGLVHGGALRLQVPDAPDIALHALISRSPGIAENEPILAGTRIRVAILYAMESKAHLCLEEIAREYPHLSPYQIEGALQYARANRDEMARYLEKDDTADPER